MYANQAVEPSKVQFNNNKNLLNQSFCPLYKPLWKGVSPCDTPHGRSFTCLSESQHVQPNHKQRVHIHRLGHQSKGERIKQ